MKARFAILSFALLLSAFGSAAAQTLTTPYLALGDSIAFGYITQAWPEYVNPQNFVAYSDYLRLGLLPAPKNLACPGETTGGFLSATQPDHGCRQFREHFPLHAPYAGTQLSAALSFLKTHPYTRLVTIQLGANDGFILEEQCAAQTDYVACMQNGLPTLLATVASNLGQIIGALRANGFKGKIIIVNYYSVDYTDPLNTAFTSYLNSALAAVAAATHSHVADVFSAFQTASAVPYAQGKTCMAGLLNVDPQNTTQCDVHPTQSGHKLIANVIAKTYASALAGQ